MDQTLTAEEREEQETMLASLHRVLQGALEDNRYQWWTPLGDLLQEDVCSALRSDDLDHAVASYQRVAQYQMAIGHPGHGWLPLHGAGFPPGHTGTSRAPMPPF